MSTLRYITRQKTLFKHIITAKNAMRVLRASQQRTLDTCTMPERQRRKRVQQFSDNLVSRMPYHASLSVADFNNFLQGLGNKILYV